MFPSPPLPVYDSSHTNPLTLSTSTKKVLMSKSNKKDEVEEEEKGFGENSKIVVLCQLFYRRF